METISTEKRKPGRPAGKSPRKAPTSFRLSPAALELITVLAADCGLSGAGVIELALRDLAKKRGVKAESG